MWLKWNYIAYDIARNDTFKHVKIVIEKPSRLEAALTS